jgi:hypothetical protein
MSTELIASICDRLRETANGKAVVIIDDTGNIVARAGDAQLLAAGDVSARKLPESAETYPGPAGGSFYEVANGVLFVSSGALTIGVLFDEQSSPGLVRLRVREARAALTANKRS